MRPCFMARVAASMAALVLAVCCAPPARADGGDANNRQAEALALFQEGRRLMEAERYAEACPKFSDSNKLDPGVGTMLNLAFCYEQLGKTASAWAAYLDAAAAARDKGEDERERVARARAAALQTELPKITVHVDADPAGDVEVRLDGSRLPRTLWDVGTPVDPGTHQVRAVAPGRLPWVAEIDADAEHPRVVDVPPLAPEAAPRPVARAVFRPAPPRSVEWQRPAAVTLGGLGVAAMGVGVAFAVVAEERYATSTSPSACNANDHCTAAGAHDRAVAFTEADVASIAVAAGVAGLAGAAVLWITAPRRSPQSVRIGVRPTAGAAVVGLGVGGSF